MEPSDVSIKHNFAVQKFSKPPHNLRTNATVIPHQSGFLATVEWRWRDPSGSQVTKPLIAVTSGVNRTKKLALSDAYRAMLIKQKLLDETSSSEDSFIADLKSLVDSGKYTNACKQLIHRNSADSQEPAISIKTIEHIFCNIWKNVIATHDYRLTEGLVSVLCNSPGGISVQLYESLLQNVVYISNYSFSERVLLLLAGDKVRVSNPERAMVSSSAYLPTESDVAKWKYWRSLLALEQVANIHSSHMDDTVIRIFSIKIDSVTNPIVRLVSEDAEKMNLLSVDNLVLIKSSSKISSDDTASLTGTITEVSRDPNGLISVTIKLMTEEGKLNNSTLVNEHVDLEVLSESRVTFDRMIKCLEEFYKVSSVPDHTFKFSETIRGVFDDDSNNVSSRFVPSTPPPNLSDLKKTLNLSPIQFSAITSALQNHLTVVHGPPGTGKTHTLCGIISAWKTAGNRDEKILACAESNAAADNIYESLKRKGIVDCFRLSTWKNIGEEIDRDVLNLVKNKAAVEKYRIALRAYRADPVKNKGYLIGARKSLEEEAIAQSQVIVTTLSSSRHPLLDRIVLPRVVIDECAQSIEPSTLLAVSHGCEQLVLVGDHKQLPAVILSREAAKMGLKKSVFEKLLESVSGDEKWSCVLLNIQRRMHPSISKFSNSTFYSGKIEDHSDCEQPDGLIERLPWFTEDKRVLFVNTAKSTKHTSGEEVIGTSTRNLGECLGIVDAVDKLVQASVNPEQIGVIVPYLAQKGLVLNLLRQKMSRENFLRLHVNTVEGFQGNEKDFIIISLVRSNAAGFVGFVDDEQRMNVMLTRARKGLIVFGDSKTFEASGGGSSLWKEWIQWCSTHCIRRELDELVE